jgi:hypothetical protein
MTPDDFRMHMLINQQTKMEANMPAGIINFEYLES